MSDKIKLMKSEDVLAMSKLFESGDFITNNSERWERVIENYEVDPIDLIIRENEKRNIPIKMIDSTRLIDDLLESLEMIVDCDHDGFPLRTFQERERIAKDAIRKIKSYIGE